MTKNNENNENPRDLNEHIDHQRWLLEHGFVNDLHKDNLFMYGSIVHKDIKAAQVDVQPEKKNVVYTLYVTSNLLKKIELYKQLSQSTGIMGMWRFKRMLKKEGNLNLKHLLLRFVTDYCGPKWSIALNLKDIKDYEEGFEEEKQRDSEADKRPDEG